MPIKVEIVSAEKSLYSGEADMVFAPAEMGEIGIAPGHMALLSRLAPGEVRLHRAGQEDESIYVSGGLVEVQPHVVTVLSDTAVRAADLDEAKAKEALAAAEAAITEKRSDVEVAKARAELLEAAAQLRTLQKIRSRR
ncbi:F0F1 ATP synthase subunit epsilon [Gammaproteobacteria bacterium]|nr:F0F1 ATP synthase subunit epsilon [Gammaproteobacteria bacterium]